MDIIGKYNQPLDSLVCDVLLDALNSHYQRFLASNSNDIVALRFVQCIDSIFELYLDPDIIWYFDSYDSIFLLYTIDHPNVDRTTKLILLGILRFMEKVNLEIFEYDLFSGLNLTFVPKDCIRRN